MYKLLDAHREIRWAERIPAEEIERALAACAGDVGRCAELLRTPTESLRREVRRLALDRVHDRVAVVAGIGAPQAGRAVDHPAAVDGDVVHVLGAGDQPRAPLEGAIGRERHPVGFEIVGDGGDFGHGAEPHENDLAGLAVFAGNDKAGNHC